VGQPGGPVVPAYACQLEQPCWELVAQAGGSTGPSRIVSSAASNDSSALPKRSAGVESEIGCLTNATGGCGKLSISDWYLAWPRNAFVTMQTLGKPSASSDAASCTMQLVHEPQSAKAMIALLQLAAMFCSKVGGQGRLNVGLRKRRV